LEVQLTQLGQSYHWISHQKKAKNCRLLVFRLLTTDNGKYRYRRRAAAVD